MADEGVKYCRQEMLDILIVSATDWTTAAAAGDRRAVYLLPLCIISSFAQENGVTNAEQKEWSANYPIGTKMIEMSLANAKCLDGPLISLFQHKG